MRRGYLLGIGALLALMLSALPASAGSAPKVPDDSVRWRFGVDSLVAGTRFDGAYVTSTGLVYFLGFRTVGNLTDGSIWTYNPVARTYADTGKDMPVPISNYQIAALQDPHGLGLYVFGGRDANGATVTTVQVFYPDTNQARVIDSDPWPGTTPSACVSLPAMGVAVVQNKAIVMGGASFSTSVPACVDDNSAQTWNFDPMAAAGARWTQGADLTMARGYITPAVLGNKVFAIGGDVNVAGALNPQSIVEVSTAFGPAWSDGQATDLPEGCDESQAFSFAGGPLAGDIVLAGCGQWPNANPDSYIYDTAAKTWTLTGLLKEPVRNHAGVLLPGGTMYILGGYDCPGNVCLADPTVKSEKGKGGAFAGVSSSVAGAAVDATPSTN
jgi:hypothetical protein